MAGFAAAGHEDLAVSGGASSPAMPFGHDEERYALRRLKSTQSETFHGCIILSPQPRKHAVRFSKWKRTVVRVARPGP